MFRSGQIFFSDGLAFARWLVLAAVLSLTLAGAGNGALSSPGESNLPAAREPSSVPVIPRESDAPAPPAHGALLTGTILSSQSADARTIISDRHDRQRVYARGDEIADGGEVVEIHREYVVVRRDGRLVRIEFRRNTSSDIREHTAAQETPPEDHREVLRHAMFTHPELLIQLVGATAVVEGGHFRGYRVMQPENPAFLESLGLKPGDLLTAVNGAPLDTPDFGAQVLDAVTGSGVLIFTVQRGGQVLVVSD